VEGGYDGEVVDGVGDSSAQVETSSTVFSLKFGYGGARVGKSIRLL